MKIENRSENVSFAYTYSANEQDEIRRIRQKYQVQEEDTMSRLRKLDATVTKKATIISLVIGIIGALTMGSGMSLVMTDLGVLLGMHGMIIWIAGIMIGGFGIMLVALAYPIYSRVLRYERKKVAPEILRLTEELMK